PHGDDPVPQRRRRLGQAGRALARRRRAGRVRPCAGARALSLPVAGAARLPADAHQAGRPRRGAGRARPAVPAAPARLRAARVRGGGVPVRPLDGARRVRLQPQLRRSGRRRAVRPDPAREPGRPLPVHVQGGRRARVHPVQLADRLGALRRQGRPGRAAQGAQDRPVPRQRARRPAQREPGPELDPPGDAVVRLLKHLARRNLLRGYALALPTGEAVAEELGLTPLSRAELAGEDAAVGAALAMLDEATGGAGTPLWYYVLREAEVQGNGAFLGEVGSRVVCETFVYLLREDETSYVRSATGWTPASGVRFEDGRMITTLVDLLRFAGVLVLDDGTTFRTV